jgi:flagella synthesis protein FlgN
MTDIQKRNEFTANLQAELVAIKAFNGILQKEQRTLVNGDVEDLDFLASEKERLIEQLSSLNQQRNQFLSSHGLLTDADGMKKLFSTDDSYSESNKIWHELLELVTVTSQLNETNGTIINTRLQHTQRSLTALQCAAGNISLYGPKGQTFGMNNV